MICFMNRLQDDNAFNIHYYFLVGDLRTSRQIGDI